METSEPARDRREVRRKERALDPTEAGELLRRLEVVHAGTTDHDGRPYVVPLVYVDTGNDTIWLHTGGGRGHFQANVETVSVVTGEPV